MTQSNVFESPAELLAPHAARVEADLRQWLVEPDVPDTLGEAMRYCVLGGGKRLRPALVFLASEAAGMDEPDPSVRRAAAAVEMLHCYSLVHDDLPAMDDDSLRRGRPTAHVRFGEAMAILAGDALLTRSLGILAEADATVAPSLVAELARAGGPAGMIAGQVADMDLCEVPDGMEGPRYIHLRKTAALIRASTRMGAICARADDATITALSDYGRDLGLAFQLYDDLLDETADAGTLGKTPGKDAAAEKRTYAALIGLDQAGRLGRSLTDAALRAVAPLGPAGAKLTALAELLCRRTH